MAKTPTDIRSLARAHTGAAINTLARIMGSPKAAPAARVAAAAALLDRGWGKAQQTITAEVNTNYVARMPAPLQSHEDWQRLYADALRVKGDPGSAH